MTRSFLVFFMLIIASYSHAGSMDKYREMGLEFGNQELKNAHDPVDQISQDDLLPLQDKGKSFDSEAARENALSWKRVPSVLDFIESEEVVSNTKNTHMDEDERFLKEDQYELGGEGVYTETCVQASDPVEFYLIRSLILDQVDAPKEKQFVELCRGHRYEEKVPRGTGEEKKRQIEKKLSRDPAIKSFNVFWKDRGMFHRDLVTTCFEHIDNYQKCDRKIRRKIDQKQEVNEVVEESWKYHNPKLLEVTKFPECVLISKTCLDDSPRMIGGQEVKRCFVEKLNYYWTPPKASGCGFLKSELCDLKSSKCLKDGPFGCALWERTFQCYRHLVKKKKKAPETVDIDSDVWDTEYEPNGNFGDVVTKLSVFKEMDHELKNNEEIDIEGFEFFSGNVNRCYVNEVQAYDCCNRMGGISNDFHVSKCDQEEKALFFLKEKGQCHYIGSKTEKVVGVKTSKKHVYCCFPSKLARVFHEKAREQLGIGWGSAENPNCQGFKRDLMAKVDMSQLDLTEAFDDPKIDVRERLERVTEKLEKGFEL